jgi:hypothetical protein
MRELDQGELIDRWTLTGKEPDAPSMPWRLTSLPALPRQRGKEF